MGSRNSALAVSCYGNRNKHLCDGPLRSNEHLCYQLTSNKATNKATKRKKTQGIRRMEQAWRDETATTRTGNNG